MKLSKEQEIYFKDSKVRDKDGNLLVCYHGDDNDFNEFKKEFIGSKSLKYAVPNVGVFGEGFYFTNESHKASRYGKVKEYYLNIKNPFIFKDYNSQEKIDALKKETDIDDIETTYNAFFDEYRVSYIDSVDSQKKFTQFLKEKGYDGIIYSDIDTFDKELEIIAFESNQIKSVDNLNPTNSNNINEAFIDDVHFDIKFQDLDLDKLESEIIDAMSDYDSEYFDDDEWHVPNYEFIERGFILRDGSEIDTGGYRHYNLEAKIRDWLMFDKHVDLSILNNTVIHKVTNALCWIRVNGLNEDYICLPTKRPNDTQLHTLEKWIDDFFRERNYQAGLRVTVGDGKQQVTYAPELTGKEIVDKIKRYYNNNVLTEKELNESLLLEKNRQELITKSKAGAEYTSKARKGQNRWTRRKYSSVANSIRDYNNINMDVFFKDDILEFVVKVHGETDDYEVTITFADILRNLQQEIKRNNNKLEFKCVLRALLTSFNSEDLFVSCTCKDFIFSGFNYYGVKQNYNSKPILGKALQAPRIKNPLDNKGSCCKHINLVISNTDWMMKVASVINNYIKWCKENMSRNYADIIFPAVYGVSYKGAIQMSLFDDPDDNGLLPSDQGTISKVIDRTMSARDTKGKFVQGNEYRFKKQDTIKSKQQAQEDNEGQLKLDLDTIKKKSRQDTIKRKQIVPEVEITNETEIEEK